MEAMQIGPYQLTKRQIEDVHVSNSCKHILKYVTADIQDERGRRKRFSLYLSAHLMFGVTSIWSKKVKNLLAEVQELYSRLGVTVAVVEKITLQQKVRFDQVYIPDAMATEANQDPLFGSWKHFNETWDAFSKINVSPSALSSIPSTSPSRMGEPLTDGPDLEQVLGSPHTVKSKEEITMKEVPAIASPETEMPIPGEVDIPVLGARELETITEGPEESMELTIKDLLPDAQPKASTPLTAGMPLARREITPAKAPTEKAEGRPKGEKKRRKRQAQDQDQTPVQQPPPHAQVPAVQKISPRRRRARRVLFVDVRIEMRKAEIRNNFTTSDTILRDFVPASEARPTAEQLLKDPFSKGLAKNSDLRPLWNRNLKSKKVDTDMDTGLPDFAGGEDEGYRRIKRVKREYFSEDEDRSGDEDRRPRDVDQQTQPDVPRDREQDTTGASMETVREGSVSRSRTPQQSSLLGPAGPSPTRDTSLSVSGTRGREDRSRDSRKRTRSAEGGSISSTEEGSIPHMDTSIRLDVLPEETEEVQLSPLVLPIVEEHVMSSPQLRFIRQCELEATGRYTTFRAMCPTTLNKKEAARCFYTLLEQCTAGSLFVRQHHPYGEIYISTSRSDLPQSPLEIAEYIV